MTTSCNEIEMSNYYIIDYFAVMTTTLLSTLSN